MQCIPLNLASKEIDFPMQNVSGCFNINGNFNIETKNIFFLQKYKLQKQEDE